MSRKLQSQIQDIKGVPGRFKRILLAWASFANNDGTNIFPSKETVGDRAGVSRWTVYENTDILEAADVLQRAGSHVCRNDRCNKGGTHWTSQHGQYTVVYKINVAMLGNPTVLLQKIKEATVAKSNSGTVGKTQPGTVAKLDTTRAVEETPAPLGIKQDSSVLTDGLVSSLASSDDSLRSSSTSMAAPSLRSEKKNQSQGSLPESIDPPAAFTVDGQLYEVDGKAQENDEETEEDKAEIDAYCQIARENNVPMLLGVPCFREEHNDALKRMAKVLVSRNRSALWLYYMVKWMKEHKAFWAKRLHAGERAINQLAKYMESGACCDQFDAFLALKNPDALVPLKYGNELLFKDPLRSEPKHDPWLEPTGSTGWLLENGTLLRPVGGGFDVEEA
jgi:hypothetical protein